MEKSYLLMRRRVELKAAKRSAGFLFLLLFLATPSIAQSPGGNVMPSPFDLGWLSLPHPIRRELITVPQPEERFEPDGAKVRQRGLIAGKAIASNVMVGVGFVNRRDRRSVSYPNLDGNSRRSGKASALLEIKF